MRTFVFEHRVGQSLDERVLALRLIRLAAEHRLDLVQSGMQAVRHGRIATVQVVYLRLAIDSEFPAVYHARQPYRWFSISEHGVFDPQPKQSSYH